MLYFFIKYLDLEIFEFEVKLGELNVDFQSLVKERRSANKFIENVTIPDQDFEDIFNLVKYVPSAHNLQHTNYLVITDTEMKNKLYDVTFKQYKILTASAAIIVLGDTKAHENAGAIYEGMKNLGALSKQEFDEKVESIRKFGDSNGEQFQLEDAIRNASLSAMQFMLAAKDKGWDTCPMYTFEPEKLREMFNIPNNLVPVLLITMGKTDKTSHRPRGYRKPIGEFVTYNKI